MILLVVALLYLIREGHGNMFFYDEWTWIETRHSGLSAILDSYNEHMEIAPLAIYQLLLHTIGLAHYHWYRLAAALGHLALVTAVYCFARRRLGPLALLVVIPLAFFGAGWEFILWGVNLGFTTSLALAVAALIWLEGDRRSSLVGCALLIASLLFTETAVLFAIGLAAELTWRDRSLRRFWVWALPLALYVAWHLGFYASGGSTYYVSQIPTFGAQLAAGASGGMFGEGEAVGWVILGLIALLLIYRLTRAGAWSPRFIAVLLTVLGYWALVAAGRANLGDPTASRYVYVGAVLLLLVIIESLRGVEVSWRSALIFAAVAALATVGGLRAFPGGEAGLFQGSTSEAAELTALQLIRRTVPPSQSIDPHWSPQIIPDLYFPATRALGSSGADTLAQMLASGEEERSSADLVLVRGGELTVTAPAHPGPTGPPAPSVELRLGGGLTRTPGCVRFTPAGVGSTLDLTLPPRGLLIRTTASASSASHPPTEIFVRRFADGYENAPVASFRGARTLLIRARSDAAPQPWHVRLSPWQTVAACTVAR